MINLNVHSCYDFLSSNIKIDSLLKKISADKQEAVAVTDFNRMHAAFQLLQTAKKYNVKPVIGMEILVDDGLVHMPFVLYAKDETGYKSLVRLSAMLSYRSLEHTPKDFFLRELSHCIVVAKTVDGANILDGMVHINDEDKYTSQDFHSTYKRMFLHEASYMEPGDLKAVKALHAIRDNERLSTDSLVDIEGPDYVILRNNVEADEDLLHVNEEIVSKCNVPLPKSRVTLPHFPHEENQNSDDFLWKQLTERLSKKTDGSKIYADRLKYEFETIKEMGYSDYFLIVSDTVNYAKNNDIYVGPGRGSSSASLVSYLLNITEIDPLEYNLLFERFLNPERVTMPDIDIDFEDTKREQVVQYLIDKYGGMNVSNIVTYGTLSAKMAARDVGRVLNFTEEELKMISNLIPNGPNVSLEALTHSEQFERLKAHDSNYRIYEDICLRIEGLPRHTSTHAAGVLLSEEKLTETIPVMFSEGHTLSQWPMTEVEAAGLLKIDVLGLRNLSLIRYMMNRIIKYDSDFDINHIPNDDENVYKVLSKGLTLGVFQLESDGIRKVIQQVVPDKFLDLAAVIALYRPGPMKEIPNFVRGQHDPSTITFPHPDLEDILRETNGVIVYQEQIMLIASKIAGYSYADADILRRAMSKKDRKTLLKEEKRFLEGAVNKNYSEELSRHIYDLILEFADYGFVKSHAVAYSQIAYNLAYIKTKYPEIFYAVILMHHQGNDDKIHQLIDEMTKMNVSIFPPEINTSGFSNKEDRKRRGVVLGLSMIKGVTYKIAEAVHNERKENGRYTDIYDLKTRVSGFKLSDSVLENLIYSGALDEFKENRATMLASLTNLSDIGTEDFNYDSFLSSLGFSPKKEYEDMEEMTDIERIEGEKEALGFYISEHPIKIIQKDLQYIAFDSLSGKQSYGSFLVNVESKRVIKTKNGQNMAFVTLTDGSFEIDGVVFPNTYFSRSRKLDEDIIVVSGKFEERNGKAQLVINEIWTIEEFKVHYKSQVKRIFIRNKDRYDYFEILGSKGIPVVDFSTKGIVGYIPEERIDKIVNQFDPEDIRLMRK